MTQVDFHINVPDRFGYACRLIRKIYRARRQVLVWSDDPVGLAEFDRLLWTFSANEFIPHVSAADPLATDTPVLLSGDVPEIAHHDVLLNLGAATPPNFSRFDRLIELVSQQAAERQAARERFRFYRDRGYPLQTHDRASNP
ncbi:MAG: DNA polymerase III subunit chi [Burkholderiaceae bacterium]